MATRWIADIRESLGPAVLACHLEGWTISSKENAALQLLLPEITLVVVVQIGVLPLSNSCITSLESLGLKVSPATRCAWWGVERVLQTAQGRIAACDATPLEVSLSLIEAPYTPTAIYRHLLFSSDEIAWQDGVVQFCRERSLDSDLSLFTALHEAEGRWRMTALAALKQRGLETPELLEITSQISSAIESPAVLHAARSWLKGDAQSDGCFRPLYALPGALAALVDSSPLGDIPPEPGWTDLATDLQATLS